MDLRWWSDQERTTNGQIRRPGRPSLAIRWGWTDRQARSIMADTAAWSDPKLLTRQSERPADVQRASSERPADVQRASNERPATSTTNAENIKEMSSERPASVQRASSDSLTDGIEGSEKSPSHTHTHTQITDTFNAPPTPSLGEKELDFATLFFSIPTHADLIRRMSTSA
jgi:hypothetical protein